MKIKIGSVIASERGIGTVVAITKHFVIQQVDNDEHVYRRDEDLYYIPITEHEISASADEPSLANEEI